MRSSAGVHLRPRPRTEAVHLRGADGAGRDGHRHPARHLQRRAGGNHRIHVQPRVRAAGHVHQLRRLWDQRHGGERDAEPRHDKLAVRIRWIISKSREGVHAVRLGFRQPHHARVAARRNKKQSDGGPVDRRMDEHPRQPDQRDVGKHRGGNRGIRKRAGGCLERIDYCTRNRDDQRTPLDRRQQQRAVRGRRRVRGLRHRHERGVPGRLGGCGVEHGGIELCRHRHHADRQAGRGDGGDDLPADRKLCPLRFWIRHAFMG